MPFTFMQLNLVTGGSLLVKSGEDESQSIYERWRRSLEDGKPFLIVTKAWDAIKNEEDPHQEFAFTSAMLSLVRRLDETASDAMITAERNAIIANNQRALAAAGQGGGAINPELLRRA